MTAPQAALNQLKQAEELHKAMYSEQDTSTAKGVETLDERVQVESKEKQSEEKNPTPDLEKNIDKEDGHVEHVSESIEDQFRKLQAQHKTLQGKYQAEVPRLNDRIRSLQQELDQAKQAKATAEQSAQEANDQLSAASSRLKEEIGDEAAQAVNEYVQETLKTSERERQDETQKVDPEAKKFWEQVYSRMPDFDSVNTDPEFINWLEGTDPNTGLTYKFLLNDAGKSLDSFTVLDITRQFKREQQTAREKPSAKDLEEHVAPPKKHVKKDIQEKPNYSPQDFVNLQNEIQAGFWDGRMEEARALEKEIHAALTGS